jgi:Ca-activated chloride channel family protein
MTKILASTCLLLVLLVQVPQAKTQQTGAAVLHVTAQLVEVPVTVLDSHGHYVDGLDRNEFKVMENGRPQTVKYFESSTDSLSCAILLDTTGSMERALPHLKNSVLRLIDQLGPDDSVMIYSFSESLTLQQDLTKDKAAAKRSVLQLRAGGDTALFDALSETSQEFGKKAGKKAIVVFTDGADNASVLTAQAAVRRAMKNGIPLFSIAEGEATMSPPLEKMLQDLSRSTGGETYAVRDLKDMEEVFQRISNAVRHIYLLSYQPPLEPADGKWRNIEVTIGTTKQYRIRAKEGYYPN